MFATDQTVRMRTVDLPVEPRPHSVIDAETVRVRPVDVPVHPAAPARPAKPVPQAVSGFDNSKTVRHRIVDIAVKPLPGAIADRIPRTVSNRPTKWEIARLLLVLVLASMPILAISVEVFGLVSQSTVAMVTITLVAVLATLIAFAPHRIDMIVGRGLIAGMVACIVYDGARLFAVHVLGLMGDFIPVMGSFVTGEPDTTGSAAVGYICRYLGDAGGLGVAFFVVAFAIGIDRWKNVYAVLAAVAFAVFPTWAGLMATVALSAARRGDDVSLNIATVIITLVGHLIFGLFLGLAFLKAPRGGAQRLAVAAAVGVGAGQAGHPLQEEGHQFAALAWRPRVVGDLDGPRQHDGAFEDHGPTLWVKIALTGGLHVFPLGSLQAVGTGAGSVDRRTGDPRQGLDQCGGARPRRHRLAPARHSGEPSGSAWSIRDVGSRNGTFVNGEKITAERVLRSGDEVRIGKSGWCIWRLGSPATAG